METEIRAIVRKDLKIDRPRTETQSHWIVTGFDEDLNEAMKTTASTSNAFWAAVVGRMREIKTARILRPGLHFALPY